jgi:hypothetical protein
MANTVSAKTLAHLALIAVIGLLAYSNTFSVPFQLDDIPNIRDNPIVKDLGYFSSPSKASGLEYYYALKRRFVGYLSFALNYRVHDLGVTGYHAVNLTVHIINALLLYCLLTITLKTPVLKGSRLRDCPGPVALISALLFVSHPVQTQAVTYITQRFASLMTMFYLFAIVCYALARLSGPGPRRYALHALALLGAALAMVTKENAFTLPLVIALYEFAFFSGPARSRLPGLLPVFLTLSIVPMALCGTSQPLAGGDTGFLKWGYLITQFRVVVTYIRLLAFPVNQNLAYDYPRFTTFFQPHVIASFVFLASLLALSTYTYFRSLRADPGLRLVAFGGLWFFVTLSIESSVVALVFVIFEHRLYLPCAGVFISVASGALIITGRFGNGKLQKAVVVSLVLVALVLACTAYSRNNVWRSGITMWEDVVWKSPRMAQGHYNLGRAYKDTGLKDRAIEQYETALRLNPNHSKAHFNVGVLYLDRMMFREAWDEFSSVLRINPYDRQAMQFLKYMKDSPVIRAHLQKE